MNCLLAIDTSTRWASVALAEDGKLVAQSVWESNQNHGAELMPAILGLLEERGRRLRDVTAVAVATGPGGFSALRVGVATAKGLALALEIPAVGVSTYDLEVFGCVDAKQPVFAVVNAGSAGVAWARFESESESLTRSPLIRAESGVESPESLVAKAPKDAVFCGEGAARLEGIAPDTAIHNASPPTRDPAALVTLAIRQLQGGQGGEPAALAPEYARPPSITRPKS